MTAKLSGLRRRLRPTRLGPTRHDLEARIGYLTGEGERLAGGIRTDNRVMAELRSERDAIQREYDRVLRLGVNPYLRSILQQLVVGAGQPGPNDDLCFMGKDGCQTHPGFNGPNGDCGVNWIRSWMLDQDQGPEPAPFIAALGSMLVEHPDAPILLDEALELWELSVGIKAELAAGPGDPGWGDRHRARLARDLRTTLKTAAGR